MILLLYQLALYNIVWVVLSLISKKNDKGGIDSCQVNFVALLSNKLVSYNQYFTSD